MSIEELKNLQKSIIRRNRLFNLLTLIVATLTAVFTMHKLSNQITEYVITAVVFVTVACIIIVYSIKQHFIGPDVTKFYDVFRDVFVYDSLKSIFSDVKYDHENGFTRSFIDKVGMLDTGNVYDSNDYISGTYKNIKFEQSDVHTQEMYEDSDGDEVYRTLFLGRVMVFDFNKKFKANLQVSSYLFDSSILPWSKRFSKVRMEDVEFNKNFNVYAEDEHEAFYLLTPQFMEKIKDVTRKLKCGVMFCFVDNKLHIAVDNGYDSFECNVFKLIDEDRVRESILKDIKLITDFVDELNLDNDLFV